MHIHFIGIGGIGVSALAQYFLSKGDIVSGSDLADSETTNFLKKKGVKVSIGKHKPENLSDSTDLLVYSPAVEFGNPEMQKARSLGIKTKSYPEVLGSLTENHFTIAVAGTHGKSTTSAMISLILANSGLDPTVLIGTKMKEFGNSNFRFGKSKYLIVEADEYKRSFLNYRPQILVLTNIEEDHLDYYKNLSNILDAFGQFLKKINRGGYLVANEDDGNIEKLIRRQEKTQFKIEKFSPDQEEARKIKENLKVPGEHNVSNALAALVSCRLLGLKDREIFRELFRYEGSWRRFQVFEAGGVTLISDYAHHPTEVEKTLVAVREKFPDRRIRCVFQPHQYERTTFFFDNFVSVLKEAPVDEIILSEIYDVAGRERKETKKKVNSRKIEKAVGSKSVRYQKTVRETESYFKKTLAKGDVLIIMGAGDIYELSLRIKNFLTKRGKN